MKPSRTQSNRSSGQNAEPLEVRIVVDFSQALESVIRALIRRLGQLGRPEQEPVPQPVRVRSSRTYPQQLR